MGGPEPLVSHLKLFSLEKVGMTEKQLDEVTMIWVFPKIGVPPKSWIFIGFSIINHPFGGTPIFGNTHDIVLDYRYNGKKESTVVTSACWIIEKKIKTTFPWFEADVISDCCWKLATNWTPMGKKDASCIFKGGLDVFFGFFWHVPTTYGTPLGSDSGATPGANGRLHLRHLTHWTLQTSHVEMMAIRWQHKGV